MDVLLSRKAFQDYGRDLETIFADMEVMLRPDRRDLKGTLNE